MVSLENSCTIGVDFGTLSARAAAVSLKDGRILSEAEAVYPHGVMEQKLNDTSVLPEGFALSDIHDYEEALFRVVSEVREKSGLSKEAFVGIGIDVTSSTFLPLDKHLKPLQDDPRFINEPHAYLKLWKHHGAISQAERISALMNERKEPFSDRAGGKVNAEWMLPKLLEICEKAPEVYQSTYSFTEAGDYLNYLLTGELTRSKAAWGYKMIRADDDPDRTDFYRALHESFSDVETRCPGRRIGIGQPAGYLNRESAKKTGLLEGIVVCAANIDAHVSAAALGIDGEGRMLAIIGTTCCAVVCDKESHFVPGISGCVKDGILPGFYGYEAGQSAVGDMFSWFERECVPESCLKEAGDADLSVQELLTRKASLLKPGQSGLIALDWWNGNRSHLADANLSGLILGLSLTTTPEDIYRALLESAAYGLKEIMDNYKEHGVEIREVLASGGIPKKNPLLMQICADVTGCDIRIAASSQASALGSAIFAAAACRKEDGGYGDVFSAAKYMGRTDEAVYRPVPENKAVYRQLFAEFKRLHDYFGTGINPVMKELKELREESADET